MPPSCPNNEKGSSSSSSSNEDSNNKKSSSWFASWFENDSSNLKQEIHQKLNEFDDYQHRHKTSHPLFGHGSTMPAAAAASAAGHQQPMSLQQEMEEFFESAGLGGIANHPPLWTTSSSSSSFRGHQGGGHYQMMRKEDQNGVQIDVQFPRAIEAETVAVEVLQESPCVVQWRNAPNGKNAREIRDRARLGDSIDCSQLSATISSVQTNMLTVKAPRYSSSGGGQAKPRVVPVTERDD